MANGVSLAFRISANLTELRQNLAEGVAQIETTKAAMTRMANSLDGSKIIADANAITKVVSDIGGASKLTEAEQRRVNATVTEAIQKYALLGKDAPAELRKLAAETRKVDDSGQSWLSMLGSAKNLLATLGIGVSITALVQMGRAILDDADALTKMHDKTGISVEGLQALRAAGDDAGVTLEAMTAAVNMLQKRLGGDDASAIAALRDLGINVKEFAALDGAQQMSALANAVGTMEDPLRVANDLSGLFGKSWAEMLPVLKRGFKEVEDGTTQMSAATVKALDDAGDAWGRFTRWFKANAGEAVADILTFSTAWDRAFASGMDAAIKKAEEAAPKFKAIIPGGLPADLDALYDKFAKDAEIIRENATAADEHEKAMKRQREEMERLTKAAQDHINSIADNLFGNDDIKRATDYAQAIGRVENVARMSAEAQEEVARVMMAGIEALILSGQSTDDLTTKFEELRLAATQTGRDGAAAWDQLQVASKLAADAAKAAGGDMVSTFDAIEQRATAAAESVTLSWSQAMTAVGKGQGTLGGTVQNAPLTADNKAAIQTAYNEGRYHGPVVNGNQQNPRGTGPDFAALGYRAMGGPVSAGSPYVVGERGPELFVPQSAGTIVANGSGGTTVNVHVDARESFYDSPIGVQRLAEKVGQSVLAQLRTRGMAVA